MPALSRWFGRDKRLYASEGGIDRQSLPPLLQRALDVVLDLLLLTVVGLLTWKSWVMIQSAQMQVILGTSLTLDVPVYGMLIGFVLLIPMICWRLLRALMGRPHMTQHHTSYEA